MRIAELLTFARQAAVDRLDAQLLVGHLLNRPRAWLLAHDDQALSDAQTAALQQQLQQRAAGVPLAYLVGEREFCGLALQVTPDVLVPRPETELLVEWALECLATAPADSVVDLGTGSGAIALAVKHRRPATAVTASDASAAALQVAQANGARHGLAVDWLQGDWWAPLHGRRYGLAVSNPPYVAGDDPHLAALSHEPRGALTPEGDGLAALRHIVQGAPEHLLPGAWLLLEHGHDQAEAVQALLTARGFVEAQTRADLAGMARCTGAAWRPSWNQSDGSARNSTGKSATQRTLGRSVPAHHGLAAATLETAMQYRKFCLGLSIALMALQAGAADGLLAPTAGSVWPQWQVRIGLQTGNVSPLSMSTAFGGTRFGLGQASAAWRNGLALTADLGLVAERLDTGNSRAIFGYEGSDSLPRDARLSPLLKLGVRYTF